MRRWVKWLLFMVLVLYSYQSIGGGLVIGTTFSAEATKHLLNEWNKQENVLPAQTLNRTSQSLKQLLSTPKVKQDVDLILSSSPMLFHYLQNQNLLTPIKTYFPLQQTFVPEMLRDTTVAFSLSGYGILSNTQLLSQMDIAVPVSWQDLTNPKLKGLVIISSPTRSDTNHIMFEAILQQYGWQQGWDLISQIMANIGTISSRSFGVVDKIQANLGGAGITIDNYAYLLTRHQQQSESSLVFNYFSHFPVSPTFIAINANSQQQEEGLRFITFLLSDAGQKALSDSETGKFPITQLPKDNALALQQSLLLQQPQLDYTLMIKRQTLVKLLFENQIIYRLQQLQENWQRLYQLENQQSEQFSLAKAMLVAVPVNSEQAEDDDYLLNFNESQELLNWQKFYLDQQIQFSQALE